MDIMSKTKKATPKMGRPRSVAPEGGKVTSIYLPDELVAAIDAARGETPQSTWIRQVLEREVLDATDKALARVLEAAAREGLTRQDLRELLAGAP